MPNNDVSLNGLIKIDKSLTISIKNKEKRHK